MADLDVQRKKKSSLPLILIGLLLLAILVYFLWNRYGDRNTAPVNYDSANGTRIDTIQRQ